MGEGVIILKTALVMFMVWNIGMALAVVMGLHKLPRSNGGHNTKRRY
jgi:hypothetical protein